MRQCTVMWTVILSHLIATRLAIVLLAFGLAKLIDALSAHGWS